MDGAKLHEIDGARAVQNMVLAAWDIGIGACWVTNFYEDGVKDVLGEWAASKWVCPQRNRSRYLLPDGYNFSLRRSGHYNLTLINWDERNDVEELTCLATRAWHLSAISLEIHQNLPECPQTTPAQTAD